MLPILFLTLSGALAPTGSPTPALSTGTCPHPSPGVVLTGVVRDTAGTPVSRAVVWSYTSEGGLRRAVSGENGAYALTNVPASANDRLGVWAASDHHFPCEIELPKDTVGAALERDVVLTRRPSIEIRLVDPTGAPLLPALWTDERLAPHLEGEVQAVATVEPTRGRIDLAPNASGNRHGIGRLRITKGEDPRVLGTLTLDAAVPVHVHLVAFGFVLASRRVEPTATDLTFEVDPADLLEMLTTVRVRFVEPDERRVLSGSGRIVASRRSLPTARGSEADADGTLTLVDQPPGRRWLRFRAGSVILTPEEREADSLLPGQRVAGRRPGQPRWRGRTYGEQVVALELEPGADVDLGEIMVEERVLVGGHAVDETGARRPTRLRLREVAPDGAIRDAEPIIYASNDDGEALMQLPKGTRYLAEVIGAADASQAEGTVYSGEPVRIDVGAESLGDLVFPVTRATFVRLVVPEFGSGLSMGARLRIEDALGRTRTPTFGGGRRVDGGYVRGGPYLAPGEYTFSLVERGAVLRSRTVRVEGETMVVRL